MKSRPIERSVAVLCYLGALRVPLVALVVPEWAFTIPGGLVVACAAWLYGRRRSRYLFHHARDGLRWSLQANLLLAAIAVAARLLHLAWAYSGSAAFEGLWHMSATVFRWTGVLVTLLTIRIMLQVAQGAAGTHEGDLLNLPARPSRRQ